MADETTKTERLTTKELEDRFSEFENKLSGQLEGAVNAIQEAARRASNGRLEDLYTDQVPTVQVDELLNRVAEVTRKTMSDTLREQLRIVEDLASDVAQLARQQRVQERRERDEEYADADELAEDTEVIMGWQSLVSIWSDAVARTIWLMEQYQPTSLITRTAERVQQFQS